MNVSKIAGERIRFSGIYGFKSPGFETNDLGFQRRADERTMNHWLQWRDRRAGQGTCGRGLVNFNQWAGWNFGGDSLLQRRQRQHALVVAEQLAQRLRRERQRRRRARPR